MATATGTGTPTIGELLTAAVAAVPGGVARPGQIEMAEAVGRAVETGEHLLVQAGTGTGKSLAYLVPAVLADGPVVVSTATLALQAQLVEADLPRLADAVEPLLGRRPSYAVLKGRHHYACLARLEAADEPDDGLVDAGGGTTWLGEAGRMGRQVTRVREWALESETGDRDELDPGVDDRVWRAVSMPARECIGASRCPYGADCFAEASRHRAREADIVVTNHSLLAVDMLSGRQILPPHRVLVVDEAHDLAERVSSAAQAELSAEAVDRATRRARSQIDGELHQQLTEAADVLTVALAGTPVGRLQSLPAPLAEALTLLDAAGRAASHKIGEVRQEDGDAVRRQQAKASVDQLTKVAQRLLECADHDVIWTEAVRRRGEREPAMGASSVVVAPLSVSALLNTHLYAERTVIATSATLTLGGTFRTMVRSLGLSPSSSPSGSPSGSPSRGAAGPEPAGTEVEARDDTDDSQTPGTGAAPDGAGAPLSWRELDVGSPFDYPKQGILYVAAHLPRPGPSGLPDGAASELVDLVRALEGRTLGLFSSRRAAERAAEVVRERTDLGVLLQGEESLPVLVRRFREQSGSCLFGVLSLWQGVDVPGDACQLVVIDRLPFPRPDEPVAAARAAAVDAAGGSGFAAVSVPAAAIRLAQGTGRLIRRSSDRGVVAVLDSRLHHSRSYGPYLRHSLPPFWYSTRRDVVLDALSRLAAAR